MTKKCTGWSLSVSWDDGTEENITTIPNWASQPIDDFITELEQFYAEQNKGD